jgi:hypothetical protein
MTKHFKATDNARLLFIATRCYKNLTPENEACDSNRGTVVVGDVPQPAGRKLHIKRNTKM